MLTYEVLEELRNALNGTSRQQFLDRLGWERDSYSDRKFAALVSMQNGLAHFDSRTLLKALGQTDNPTTDAWLSAGLRNSRAVACQHADATPSAAPDGEGSGDPERSTTNREAPEPRGIALTQEAP